MTSLTDLTNPVLASSYIVEEDKSVSESLHVNIFLFIHSEFLFFNYFFLDFFMF